MVADGNIPHRALPSQSVALIGGLPLLLLFVTLDVQFKSFSRKMGRRRTLLLLPILVLLGLEVYGAKNSDGCVGEFQRCPKTGECTLFECDGPGPHCAENEYRCPISNHCIKVARMLCEVV